MDTKIKPSQKPPAFFKDGSNLQQLLDLKYNMSNDNYDCKICGDIVDVSSNFIHGLPVATNKATTTKPTKSTIPKNPAAPTTFKPTDIGYTLQNPDTSQLPKVTARPTTR